MEWRLTWASLGGWRWWIAAAVGLLLLAFTGWWVYAVVGAFVVWVGVLVAAAVSGLRNEREDKKRGG